MSNTNLIYDIGVHNGKDSLFYLLKGFKVIGIEANPSLVENLRSKFSTFIESGQYILIDKAISKNSNKKIPFYINDKHDDWGTSLDKWNRSMCKDFTEINIETISPEDIINLYGIPYYMKIDIEGSDVLILDSLIQLNKKPLYLSIELLTPDNFNNDGCNHLEIITKLKQLGYTKFVISNQGFHKKLSTDSQEGKNVNYEFDGYCSGLFGKDIFSVETELSCETIIKKYNQYFVTNTDNDLFNRNCWYDIHCTY